MRHKRIPNVGLVLKLMVDEIEGLKVLVTGSSAFDIDKFTGEPLTGRKKTFHLLPLSEGEYQQIETLMQRKDQLHKRLIYGNYPELIHIPDNQEKADYLNELVNSYLLKDILAFENIRNSDKILNLLRLIAFQIGGEERAGQLFGYEFKWKPKKQVAAPAAWQKAYPNAKFEVIHSENYTDWLSLAEA